MKQYNFSLNYTDDHNSLINHLLPLRGHEWDKPLPDKNPGSATKRNNLKKFIRTELESKQGLACAFCSLELYTRVPQIEHIAPKSKERYPKFMFESKNLILACSLCNGFSKKSDFDTIETYTEEYEGCTFKIIHPYFDNPLDHLTFENDPTYNAPCIIKVKITDNIASSKGKTSIKLFSLDAPHMTEARCREYISEKHKLSAPLESLVQAALKNEYSR